MEDEEDNETASLAGMQTEGVQCDGFLLHRYNWTSSSLPSRPFRVCSADAVVPANVSVEKMWGTTVLVGHARRQCDISAGYFQKLASALLS